MSTSKDVCLTSLGVLSIGRVLAFEHFTTYLQNILPTLYKAISCERDTYSKIWACDTSKIKLLTKLLVIIPLEDTFHLCSKEQTYQLDYRIQPLYYIDGRPVLISVMGFQLALQQLILHNGDIIVAAIYIPTVLSTLYLISKHAKIDSVDKLRPELINFKVTLDYLCKQQMLKTDDVYYTNFGDCLKLLSFNYSSSDHDFLRGSTNRDLIQQIRLSYGQSEIFLPKPMFAESAAKPMDFI